MRRTIRLGSVIKNKLENSKLDKLCNNHVYSELDVNFITKMCIDPNNNIIGVTLSNSGLERVENWSGEFLEEMYVDKECKPGYNTRMFHTKTSTSYQFTRNIDFEFLPFNDKFC